jgi:hypothetical protein
MQDHSTSNMPRPDKPSWKKQSAQLAFLGRNATALYQLIWVGLAVANSWKHIAKVRYCRADNHSLVGQVYGNACATSEKDSCLDPWQFQASLIICYTAYCVIFVLMLNIGAWTKYHEGLADWKIWADAVYLPRGDIDLSKDKRVSWVSKFLKYIIFKELTGGLAFASTVQFRRLASGRTCAHARIGDVFRWNIETVTFVSGVAYFGVLLGMAIYSLMAIFCYRGDSSFEATNWYRRWTYRMTDNGLNERGRRASGGFCCTFVFFVVIALFFGFTGLVFTGAVLVSNLKVYLTTYSLETILAVVEDALSL